MTDFPALLQALSRENVEFILVGGVAATAHGAARLTQDLDIVYRRSAENIERVVKALKPLSPYLRNAPRGLPFLWDSQTLRLGQNFTLTTAAGEIDILGEITGGGDFNNLKEHCITLSVYGIQCLCLGLETLIFVKRAAGRPKDFEAVAELEAIFEARKRPE
jgi:hypothetical protein